jgi:transcriptional regulator with XRE-family HTH domain
MAQQAGSMFARLGPALVLLRELVGKPQRGVAREAGLGASQLSLSETGSELPKLGSLEKVLTALGVGPLALFATLDLVDRRAMDLFPQENPPPVPSSLLPQEVLGAFKRTLDELVSLQRTLLATEALRQMEGKGTTTHEKA